MNGKIEKVLWHESDDVSKIEFSIFAKEAFLKKRAAADLSAIKYFHFVKMGDWGISPTSRK